MEFSSPSRFLKVIDPKYLDRSKSAMYSTRRSVSDEVELPWLHKEKPRVTTSSFFEEPRTREPLRPLHSTSPSYPRPVIPSSQPVPSVPSSSSAEKLEVGFCILHNRFGRGEVLRIEGTGDMTKATVQFENVGTKQVLLKFAKFTII